MRLFVELSYLLAVPTALFCLYAAMFFGWLTATPLTPAQRDRAAYDANAWFVLFIASAIAPFLVSAVHKWLSCRANPWPALKPGPPSESHDPVEGRADCDNPYAPPL